MQGTSRPRQQPVRHRGESRLRPWLPLAALVALAMILRFWRVGDPPVLGDESYYWLWSRHPALSYLDNPAGVAWLVWLSTSLGGHSEFGLRWLNALLGLLSVPLMYGLARQLFGARAGLLAAAFLAVGAPYLVVSRFVYTDALPIFLLLLNLNLLAPVLRTGPPLPVRRRRWLAIGLTWALLLNTKISVYPYALGLALGILTWRRDLLRYRRFWLAVAIAALGTLPWLLWNAAHAWAGLRWMWQHTVQGTVPATGPLSSAYHILTYLSPGLLLFVLLGFLSSRVREGQWLILLALLQLLPVALSAANSPRNLLVGCLPLLAAAAGWASASRARFRQPKQLLAGTLWVLTALVGLGTTVALVEDTALPQSSVTRSIRQEVAAVRELGAALRAEQGVILTVDYNLAAQLWYYSGRPVYTSWAQYQLWGVPDFDAATVLSLGYVPNERVTAVLAAAFRHCEGPSTLNLFDGGLHKRVYLWRGMGRQVPETLLLHHLDWFTLAGAAGEQEP